MKKCLKCNGKGKYLYHLEIEELQDLASYGGTTNYNPDYMKECAECKGVGRMETKKKLTIKNCNCRFTKTGKIIKCKFHKQCIDESGTILPKTWGQLKPIKSKLPEFFVPFFPANNPFSNNSKAPEPKCRFCGGETRVLNSNGIIVGGFKEWDYVCKACGKVQ